MHIPGLLRRLLVLAVLLTLAGRLPAEGLGSDRLGVIFNVNDPASIRAADYYARRRHIPPAHLVGLAAPEKPVITREELARLREGLAGRLPKDVQALLLIWSKPYAAECMSITTAVAAGYQADFCEPGCGITTVSPLFNSEGWLPRETAGWLPAMLLPSEDEPLARALIDRGVAADGSHPPGTVYLINTQDGARNVRSRHYAGMTALISGRTRVEELTTPLKAPPGDIIGYFTGVMNVEELPRLRFRPGALADHLTSIGGVLPTVDQMSALEWLKHGATASYGTVTEPCNHLGKFPDPGVLFNHYLQGETALEAYWKSVVMPGQGLFIGEPLARPYGTSR